MRFHIYLLKMLFVGATLILICVNSYQEYLEDEKDMQVQGLRPTLTPFRPSEGYSKVKNEEIAVSLSHLLKKDPISRLLSPDLFSIADPFQYLIRATNNLRAFQIIELDDNIKIRLKQEKIPKIFIPYAKALRSILQFQRAIESTKLTIGHNRIYLDHSTIPVQVSSPSEFSTFGLFPQDLFFDSDLPIHIFNTLTKIPKNEILKLITELDNYLKPTTKWIGVPFNWWRYKKYAEELLHVLKTNILDDLESNMAEIRRISTISRQNYDTVSLNIAVRSTGL